MAKSKIFIGLPLEPSEWWVEAQCFAETCVQIWQLEEPFVTDLLVGSQRVRQLDVQSLLNVWMSGQLVRHVPQCGGRCLEATDQNGPTRAQDFVLSQSSALVLRHPFVANAFICIYI